MEKENFQQKYEEILRQNDELKLAIEQAEKQIILSEIKWKTTFDGIKDSVFLLNEEGIILHANKTSLDFFKKSEKEIIGKHCYEIVHNTFYHIENCPFIKMKESKQRETIVLTFADKWFEVTCDPLFDNDKKINGSIHIISDITQRKKEEEEMKKLAFRQKALLSAIPDIIMEVDNNKVYTWANSSGINFFGDDVVGKEAAYYFEGEQETYDAVNTLFSGDENVFYVESWQRRKDGQRRLLAWWCQVLKDENGNVKGALSTAHDITEHKKVEATLKESEKRFRTVVEEAVEIVYTINSDGYFTYVNQAGIKSSGYSFDELTKLKYIDLIEKEYKQQVKRNYLRQFLEKKELSTTEYPYRTKSGEIKWFNQNARLLFEENELKGFFVIARDVTERRKAEEELQKSKSELQEYFENDISADYVVSTEGDIFSCNKTFLQLFGFEEKSHVEKFNISQLYKNPDDRKKIIRKIKENGRVENLELDFISKEGKTINAIINSIGIFNDAGELIKIRGYIVDITARKQAEEALLESQSLYYSFIEQLPNAVFRKDMEGRYVLVNSEFCKLKGLQKEDLIGKKPMEIATPLIPLKGMNDQATKYADAGEEIHELILQTGKTFIKEEEYPSPDVRVRYMHAMRMPVVDSNGTIIGSQGIMFDITERKQAEKAQKEIEELFSLFMKYTPVYTFIKEVSPTQSKVLQASENFQDMIGIPGSKMTGKTMEELFPKEFAAKISADDWEVVKNGKVLHLDEDLNNKNYTTIKFPIYQGEKKLLAGFTIDNTDRKKAEDALKESEKKYSSLFNSMNEGVVLHEVVYDKNNKAIDYLIVDSNPSFERHTGIQHDNSEYQLASEFYGLTNAPYLDIYSHVAETGVPTHFESYFTPLDKHFDISVFSPKKGMFATIFTDITERKKSEEALRESKQLIEGIINAINVRVFWKDKNLVYLGCNEIFARDAGFAKPEDIVGKNDYQMGWHDQAELYRADDRQIINTGTPMLNIEEAQTTPDGKTITLLTNKIPLLNFQGEISGVLGTYMDITERKKSELELKEKNQLIESIVNLSPYILYIYDIVKGKNIYSNDGIQKILGYSVEEIKGYGEKLIEYLMHPDDFQTYITETFPKYLHAKDNELIIHQYRMKDKSGLWHWLDSNEIIYKRKTDGTPMQIFGVIQDITDRIISEEKLKESEERFKQISENSQEWIWEVDSSGLYTYSSKIVENVLGYKEEEIVGKKYFYDFFLPDEKEQLKKAAFNLFKQKQPLYEFTNRNINKKGEIVWLSTSGIPVIGKDGNLIGYRGADINITERKKAEEEILILAHSLKSINECVSITDLEDNILFVNQSFLKTYGYSEDELFGKNISIVRSQNNPPGIFKEILPATIDGGWKGELKNKRKDGSEFPIYLSTTIIKDTNNKPIGLIGVASDITERLKSEMELIHAKEKAEESDRLKSAFLANMSHEIRTPMNGIMGFAELLKEPKLSGEQQQKYLSIIEKSGTRMLNIINDIINISKIEAGQMELSIIDTNVNEQIEYIYTFFKPEAEQKGLQINLKYSLPSNEAIIQTDREKIFAILTNLVKNALKFTKEGFIELGYEKKGQTLEFFVKDTGLGIPFELQDIIFERFRQGSELLTRNYEGSGLGLSITKAYVELLGGKIWVESNYDIKSEIKGSTFYFTIPYNVRPEGKMVNGTQIPENKNEVRFKKLKILIAEDDQPSEILINIVVESFAKEILKVKTGSEAVVVCRDNPDIDLVLMDIQMPGMDGYEATRQIRQFNKEVIIIAQTAYGFSADRVKAIEAGCNDYISKPIKKEILKELISGHIKD